MDKLHGPTALLQSLAESVCRLYVSSNSFHLLALQLKNYPAAHEELESAFQDFKARLDLSVASFLTEVGKLLAPSFGADMFFNMSVIQQPLLKNLTYTIQFESVQMQAFASANLIFRYILDPLPVEDIQLYQRILLVDAR